MKSIPFTTDDLVLKLGVSRVSVRKYLKKFMKDIGVLDVQIHYGTVGRPVSQHKLKQDHVQFIEHY
ncbi:hypothetical protein [Fictibacillus sp. NRS-1165]|uniref:hypothetical protein n=1 Tax=Fictibacillus sp. NRS-1165 TaxID=3144463 RepID=UPI003D1F04A9